MKYWCANCKKTVGGNAADNHSADGHVIFSQPDRPADRPRKRPFRSWAVKVEDRYPGVDPDITFKVYVDLPKNKVSDLARDQARQGRVTTAVRVELREV